MSISISTQDLYVRTYQTAQTNTPKTADASDDTAVAKDGAADSTKVSLQTGSSDTVVYADPRLNKTAAPDLQALLEESDRKAQEIVNLIKPLVEQQGLNLSKVVSGEQKISASPETIKAAQTAVADGGEFSVQKTAERILSFAKAAIGDDPAKLDKITAAVEQGFKEASDILGGSLPDISKQTLESIRTEFSRWKSEGIPSGDTVSLTKPATSATQKAA
ncbi:hypothetical protein H8L32_09145 [Undibacterium sp. CY18W]|uniref:DUF5610 domain-containing protein n=1 Tax=Undibacterium hunanense TaxID=2762292 RepID=A0ABR6ZP05_9BURK|nr:DUF5610 domain-containing protein [Undibacterium hunanense]MBC3917636.1 hypothetical protein [Undibacterium hunanense]